MLENKSDRCAECVSYRVQLNILVSRVSKSMDSSDPRATPTTAISLMHRKTSTLKNCTMRTERQNDRFHTWKRSLERIEADGQQMDETSLDLKQIMEENDQTEAQYPEDSFMYLFLRQQREALAKKDHQGMRRHPLMIQ